MKSVIDFHVIIVKIRKRQNGVFPTHAVGNGVYEEINLVRGNQRNTSHEKYIREKIWIHHRLIIFELRDKRLDVTKLSEV